MKHNKVSKYIPLNAGETAVLQDANTILPRDEIYEPLVELIKQARNRAAYETNEVKSKSLSNQRVHNAISIDGARGTGKTAVLVNLKRYIELEHKELLTDIHILEPIDPTLLEDGESLFLHIIVAAVLHDDDIKHSQHSKPEQSRALNQALDKLAHSLEAVDTQKERHGMDKVRAMYGNKHLADSVHNFFLTAARLLDKKLLILPIDDVDTSLNLAFENLEIIRRYLTTPYVLPIVSGDRALYHEVTWRDFHGRLIKDSTYRRQEAYTTAVDLAEEYQRKVLPFPRRQIMPEVSNYWQWNYDRKDADDKGVMLGNTSNGMPLANFISWLEIYLTGPVNGQENSRLPLPIPSIRALTQLVNYCSDLITALPDAIRTANNELEVRRIWQMPTVPLAAIASFQAKHQDLGKEKKREYGDAYKIFFDKFQSESVTYYSYHKLKQATQQKLAKKLADYFRFEPQAGAIYLILLAKQHWQNWANPIGHVRQGSIFDTPLFQPLTHNKGELAEFKNSDDLSAWSDTFATRLPASWLAGLKSLKTILPYPVAEVGINASKNWNYQNVISSIKLEGLDDENRRSKAEFIINLLAQQNFYTNAKETMLLNIGRIFELIIASIVGPVSSEDLQVIMVGAPFFSTRALAPTKTLLYKADDEKYTIEATTPKAPHSEFDPIAELNRQINEWREGNNLEQIELSPWLVYKVFNKVYSQVASGEIFPSGMQDISTALNIAANTFYSTWSAFGSFEKGELFGLPNVVTTTNINPENLKNFESNDHFTTNVGPFAPTRSQIANKQAEPYKNRSKFGKETRTISYFLAEHPLKKWIDELIMLDWPKPLLGVKESRIIPKSPAAVGAPNQAKKWLCEKLNITVPKTLKLATIQNALIDWDIEQCNMLLNEINKNFTDKSSKSTIDNLEKAIKKKTESS
ncbi:MAG: antiviral RADAR system adenosine triphosphatase RdrA [Aeromonas hydrophila]